jgi:aldose 1-epimerase
MTITEKPFGVHEGRSVSSYILTNTRGLAANLINFGARLTGMMVPDRDGAMADVVLGFDDLAAYAESDTYFGATCGRYGNRIKQGRFTLGERSIEVSRNDGPHHLHGGFKGFDKRVWDAQTDEIGNSIVFTLMSDDGDEGFPGKLVATSRYRLTEDDRLVITMTAWSDQETVVNLVHHSYWNLAGHQSGDVLGQVLTVNADFYTPVDEGLIPTGEILSVADTAFDFREGKEIGHQGGRYDHNWVIRDFGPGLHPVATLHDPQSGRVMELMSSEPGVQIYTACHLDRPIVGKDRHRYGRCSGVAFETQKFPNSPNFAHFPDARLEPGEVYDHRMEIRFSVR